MVTKIQAADLARRSGTTCFIASGKEPDVLLRLVAGERLGTRFEPVADAVESRKRYTPSARRAPGVVSVDEGAAQRPATRWQPAAGRCDRRQPGPSSVVTRCG